MSTGTATCLALVLSALLSIAASAQTTRAATRAEQSESISGTVVSTGSGSIVVETDANEFVVFRIERGATRPATIARGSRVTVVSGPAPEPGEARVATRITVDRQASATADPGDRPVGSAQPSAIPPQVRRLERQIERQVRRYGVGVRGGVALDPELVTVGVHARVGPFFDENLFFRPNLEFAFGEVTALFAVNLEAVYRLPVTRQGRWSAYVGGGPTFAFIDRGFSADDDGRSIDFDEFSLDEGFSLLGGVEYPNGAFIELKGTAYTAPNIRLLVGFTF